MRKAVIPTPNNRENTVGKIETLRIAWPPRLTAPATIEANPVEAAWAALAAI
jgi:hypothetical protein